VDEDDDDDEDRRRPLPALDCLKVLLEEGGADANSEGTEGDTPLHDLCDLRDTVFGDRNAFDAALDLLLAHGADINARNFHGRTPLIYCAAWGEPAWVPQLLAQGADPDAIDKDGFTALVFACGRGAEEESPAAVLELLRRSSRETRRAVDYRGWSTIDELVYDAEEEDDEDGDPLSPRLPPWQTRAIRQLLLSGVTCRDDHAPIVLPIAAELMALQDVELEQLRS
jgi:ankyrin repeat protein